MNLKRCLPVALLAALACSGPSLDELQQRAERAAETAAEARSEIVAGTHRGPGVTAGAQGPARFAEALYAAFQPDRAFQAAAFADRYYREPGSDGYEATLDFIERGLREAGFGGDERLRLEVLRTEPELPGWTPRRARLALLAGGAEQVLHAFESEVEKDRVMLPRHAPSARVEGEVAFELAQLGAGQILVTRSPLRRDLINRAAMKGAAAVVSASLGPYNQDPTGQERHLDAIQYRDLGFEAPLPVAQISPRSHAAIEEAVRSQGSARLAFECQVDVAERPLRTLVATVVGRSRPSDAVVIVSHVQEPGACDNASGVAGLLESARVLADLLRAGEIAWPARSLVCVWGEEMVQSRTWLERTELRPVAALSADMTGQSRERTGAVALLERAPDPGAVEPLPPDEHTPLGGIPPEPASLSPSGLALIARCALADVGRLAGGWETAEHPWEGSSDHDVFLEHGVPAVLLWHFDFTYHTSLDRLNLVDPEELRRTSVAILATALAVADPEPADLDRYLHCLNAERALRVQACEDAARPELAALWRTWCTGARMWLREQCLDLPPGASRPAAASDAAGGDNPPDDAPPDDTDGASDER